MEHYTAQEAAARLGVTKTTLYAYVSRGLIRSELLAERGRAKAYSVEDVEALVRKKAHRKDPGEAVREALDHGLPVLDTRISTIHDGTLWYRGRAVETLMEGASFEEVVGWLMFEEEGRGWHASVPVPGGLEALGAYGERFELMARCQAALLALEQTDVAAYGREEETCAACGAKIVHAWWYALTGRPLVASAGLATQLAGELAPQGLREEAARWIEMALIACVDHELNASTFAARCAAGAGATPYGAATAGMATLLGRRHAGNVLRIGSLFEDMERAGTARAALTGRLRRGERVPGFGHALYPQGDVRARVLLAALRATAPEHQELERSEALEALMLEASGLEPAIDYALVVLTRVLGAKDEVALLLFALARCIGWMAHVAEQYDQDLLLRPRAQYTGRMPG